MQDVSNLIVQNYVIESTWGVHKVNSPLVSQLVNYLLRDPTACTWQSNEFAWPMHQRDFPSSHCGPFAVVEDGGSYSNTSRLWSAVCDKVFNAESTATDTRTQGTAQGVSIEISAAVP